MKWRETKKNEGGPKYNIDNQTYTNICSCSSSSSSRASSSSCSSCSCWSSESYNAIEWRHVMKWRETKKKEGGSNIILRIKPVRIHVLALLLLLLLHLLAPLAPADRQNPTMQSCDEMKRNKEEEGGTKYNIDNQTYTNICSCSSSSSSRASSSSCSCCSCWSSESYNAIKWRHGMKWIEKKKKRRRYKI